MARSVYYAFTRTLDPSTGQPVLSGGAWVPGSPAMELVVSVIRTERGSFLPDPTFGVRYSVVDRAAANAPHVLETIVTEALQYLVDGGHIANLAVRAKRKGAALQADIDFTDPRGVTAVVQRARVVL